MFFQFLTLIKVDYFEVSWPGPIHDETKHACNGEQECFQFARHWTKRNSIQKRSFEGSIDTFFSLFDTDLFPIWMNTFRHGFCFCLASCQVLPIMLIISLGECRFCSTNSLLRATRDMQMKAIFGLQSPINTI